MAAGCGSPTGVPGAHGSRRGGCPSPRFCLAGAGSAPGTPQPPPGGGALLTPLLWFGGDWIGSGNVATAAGRALRVVPGSPGASNHPAAAVAGEALRMLPAAGWIGLAAALIWGVLRQRKLLVLAGA